MSEAFAHFQIDGERCEMTPDNTSVFIHLGVLAVYDHLFIQLGETSGAYIWRGHQSFDQLLGIAAERQCTIHFNIRKVSEQDEKVYMEQAMGDVYDTIPDDW